MAAVEAGKHIFAEKHFGTDPVGVRKVMAATKKAEQLKLIVMSGAQRHHRRYRRHLCVLSRQPRDPAARARSKMV